MTKYFATCELSVVMETRISLLLVLLSAFAAACSPAPPLESITPLFDPDSTPLVDLRDATAAFVDGTDVVLADGSRVALPLDEPDFANAQFIREIDGDIWLSSFAGLSRFREGTWTHYPESTLRLDSSAGGLFLQVDGRSRHDVWAGNTHTGTVCRFQDDVVTCFDGFPDIQEIAVTEAHFWWIPVGGDSLHVVRKADAEGGSRSQLSSFELRLNWPSVGHLRQIPDDPNRLLFLGSREDDHPRIVDPQGGVEMLDVLEERANRFIDAWPLGEGRFDLGATTMTTKNEGPCFFNISGQGCRTVLDERTIDLYRLGPGSVDHLGTFSDRVSGPAQFISFGEERALFSDLLWFAVPPDEIDSTAPAAP